MTLSGLDKADVLRGLSLRLTERAKPVDDVVDYRGDADYSVDRIVGCVADAAGRDVTAAIIDCALDCGDGAATGRSRSQDRD